MTDMTKDQIKTDQDANKAVNNFGPKDQSKKWSRDSQPTTPKQNQNPIDPIVANNKANQI